MFWDCKEYIKKKWKESGKDKVTRDTRDVFIIFIFGYASFFIYYYEWDILSFFPSFAISGLRTNQFYTLIFALIGAYLFYRRLRATEEQLKITAIQVQEDRFAKAYEQFGNTNLSIRLGGYNLLQTLSRESPEYRERVWKYLSAALKNPPNLEEDESLEEKEDKKR